ncbi:hypothetical protein ABFB09_08970 [Dehalogenimonas sp. THU2]|uniref:hypothetical protein n=1 Tax=Dehalogenimonas sp. THU2 TaxID=3151121 RepID=UPI00321873BC
MKPAHWSTLTLVVTETLAVIVASRQLRFIEEENIGVPVVTAGPPLIYFFVAVAVMSLALAFLPLAALKFIAKALFLILYAWGVFVVLALPLSVYPAAVIAGAGALAWLKWPRLWLHNMLLGVALVGYASVFGFLVAPIVALVLMAAISVYDLVSVRSGHMIWMVSKLSGVNIVPAFVFPLDAADWRLSITDIKLDEPHEKAVSLLGGGDIGFSLIMVVAVLTAGGIGGAAVMAGFMLAGLLSVYWVQKIFYKGGPTAAMPPLTVAAAAGYGVLSLLSML